jgi:sulfide:quinone oxidoreductase
MSRVVILGAGIAGHTAALFLRQKLSKKHEVVVVTPNSKWNWIPSNIWVGVGRMTEKDVTFELDKVYKKQNITYIQAKAVSIHPEGGNGADTPYVTVEYTGQGKEGQQEAVTYDYMINATGPKLNFAATEGLGPDKFTTSVCTASHATHANQKLQEAIQQMKAGNNQHILIGLGHGMATCQGAAFEYIFNVEYELRKAGVRDKAKITYISNESVLGDFGVGGMHVKRGGYMTHSKVFTESLFSERGVGWITGAHVEKVEEKTVHYELLDGTRHTVDYDMAMLIPPFSGHGLKAFDASGADITEKLFAPNGFMKVDADYTQKPYEEWKPSDWPRTYQNPIWKNLFAAGIAFAPPHLISKPMKSANGTPINPTPPRTGMPSAMIGKAVALSVADMVKGKKEPTHTASMAELGAACVASTGKGFFGGTAAAMTMFPVVPDYEKYPGYGRDTAYSFGEIGTAAHWIKHLLHHMFLYKAKAKAFWWTIPE